MREIQCQQFYNYLFYFYSFLCKRIYVQLTLSLGRFPVRWHMVHGAMWSRLWILQYDTGDRHWNFLPEITEHMLFLWNTSAGLMNVTNWKDVFTITGLKEGHSRPLLHAVSNGLVYAPSSVVQLIYCPALKRTNHQFLLFKSQL